MFYVDIDDIDYFECSNFSVNDYCGYYEASQYGNRWTVDEGSSNLAVFVEV